MEKYKRNVNKNLGLLTYSFKEKINFAEVLCDFYQSFVKCSIRENLEEYRRDLKSSGTFVDRFDEN